MVPVSACSNPSSGRPIVDGADAARYRTSVRKRLEAAQFDELGPA